MAIDTTHPDKRYFVTPVSRLVRYSRHTKGASIMRGHTGNRQTQLGMKYVYTATELLENMGVAKTYLKRIATCKVGTVICGMQRISAEQANEIRKYEEDIATASERMKELDREIQARCADLFSEKKQQEKRRAQAQVSLDKVGDKITKVKAKKNVYHKTAVRKKPIKQ